MFVTKDPDPNSPQNVTDREHWLLGYKKTLDVFSIEMFLTVLRIRIRIRIHMFLGLLDPDPDPSNIELK
jgi:hypothetical protein